jgi:saccharopepsin
MRVAPLVLLLPFVAAQGVRKLKLQKLPAALGNQELETAYLAEKYGGVVQAPLLGAGGSGRQVRLGNPAGVEDELFWTQEENEFGSGHNVPLSSTSAAP